MKWIPIELIQEVIKKKKEKAFKVYVLMNSSTDGYFKRSEEVFAFIMNKCSIKTKKTLESYFEDLLQLGYFGYSDGIYYIRSTKKLKPKCKYHVEVSEMYFETWTSYMAGAFIGWLAKHQRIKEGAVRRFNVGTSYQKLPHSFPVSIASIMKTLGLKQYKSHKYRILAENNGFIKLVKGNCELTNLKSGFYALTQNYLPGYFLKNGKVFKRLPDEVIPYLTYKRKKQRKKAKHKG